jgi:membrane protease YdiL (CAAX protease family)
MDSMVRQPGLSRALLIVQLALVLFTIEAALWTNGRTQLYWFAVAFSALIICVITSRPQIKDLGLGTQGMAGASWSIGIAVVFSCLFVLGAWAMGTLRGLHGEQPVSWHAIFYTIWAFEQQFILNSFFYKRFEWLLGNGPGAMFSTALLFALVHLPNPVLVPATFLGGLFFVAVYRRWRNIYPLAIAHAIMGLTLAVTFPDTWIRHMRVGLGYLRFHLG